MKKIQLSILALVMGTALAFAGSKSFTFHEASSLQWFQLITGGDPSDPNDYVLTDAPEGCDGDETRCAIYAEEDMAHPGQPTQQGVNDPVLEEFKSL